MLENHAMEAVQREPRIPNATDSDPEERPLTTAELEQAQFTERSAA
jgi:hypothetical protein